MKIRSNLFLCSIAMLAVAVTTTGTTCAANRFWDTATTANLQAGSGTWDMGSTALWSSVNTGSNPLVVFNSGDDAFFQTGGANAVTLSSPVTAASVTQTTASTATTISGGGTLTVSSGNITNSGNTAFSLNQTGLVLGATGTISATSAINIGAAISGTSGIGFNKAGTATLTLSGDNTFTGPMTVNSGLVANTRAAASGTPFGTGSINLNGFGGAQNFGSGAVGLSIIPNAAGTTAFTGGTQSGSQLSFANTAYINLTRFDASSPLSYTYGSGSGSVLNRVDKGVLVFMDNTTATPANMGVSGGNNFTVNGTAPTVTNGMVAAYYIGARNGGNGESTFLTYDSTYGFKPVTYDVTNSLTGWDNTKKVTISSGSVATDSAAYALRTTGAITINSGVTVSIGNGGSEPAGLLAYNNISGGTLAFGNSEGLIFTGGANSTISSSITGSGGLTKSQYAGTNGQLTLTGSNSYSGTTTVTGVLNIGSNGTTGDLGNSKQVVLGAGATLNFNRSNAVSYTGTITGGGTVVALNATPLTLGTELANDVSNVAIRAAQTASISITKGTWNTPNLGVNATGAQMRGTLSISDATVNVTSSARYSVGNYNIQSGGSLVVSANDRFTYAVGNEQTGSVNHTMNISTGGTLDVYSSQFGTAFGNGSTSNTVTINQSGGMAKFGVNDSTSTSNRNLTIGGTNANAKTAYDLSGGTMMVRGTLQSGGAAGTGGINNFNFRGGVLVAANITTANLGSTDSTTDPVANSLSIGTLVNRGGTLAPGNVGTVGKTNITGSYTINSGTMTIDIGGTTASSLFQEAANSGKFDNIAVTGNVSLGGLLAVSLVDNFINSIQNTQSFTILTSGGLVSDTSFSNVAFGSRITTIGNEGSFLVTKDGNNVVLSDWQVIPEPRAALLGGLGLLALLRRRRN